MFPNLIIMRNHRNLKKAQTKLLTHQKFGGKTSLSANWWLKSPWDT